MTGAREEYQRRLAERRAALAECHRRHRMLGNVRLLLVAVSVIVFVVLRPGLPAAWWLLAPAAVFFAIGVRLETMERVRGRLDRAVRFYERAAARVNGEWAGQGENGSRFLDDAHLYARDLDIFGAGSLFELLCSARTPFGEEKLAAWLREPTEREAVNARQEAVTELTGKMDLREDVAVIAESARSGVHGEELAAWGERAPLLESSLFRVAAYGLSALGALACAALVAYVGVWLGVVFLPENTLAWMRIFIIVVGLAFGLVLRHFRRRTERILAEADQAAHDLALLAGVLERFEAERFTAPKLARLRADLETEGRPPSRRIAQLKRLMDLADSRHHALMGVIGTLLLWDLHVSYALEDWRRTSGRAMRRWLNAVGEMEAISSLAGYRYENPDTVYAELIEGETFFEAEALAHPLLRAPVANDLALGRGLCVMVVSGSNMSGKSTMLRTIGVSAVMAQAGAPVRARTLRLSPLAVGASIRIQDSLQAGESRFYAEITRLRRIVDRAGGLPPVLFLIDEFLHGTNSHDRRIGAEAVVRSLVERGAIGLATTHDLALADIAEALGERGANVHFEDHLEDGRMRFDYRMRPGVVRKSNAIELMRSVGLEV
ncbi:MAG: MutS-related protein [Bryobacteraceae bacterium]